MPALDLSLDLSFPPSESLGAIRSRLGLCVSSKPEVSHRATDFTDDLELKLKIKNMKHTFKNQPSVKPLSIAGTPASLLRPFLCRFLASCVLALSSQVTQASIAYGSINNFDTVNDSGVPCHGFEIELDDIHSTDITYTYDYNHYGTPKITEDTISVPGHTNVYVRYEAVWTNTGWSGYTAVPTNNIPPTQGHAFTNPSLNFGSHR